MLFRVVVIGGVGLWQAHVGRGRVLIVLTLGCGGKMRSGKAARESMAVTCCLFADPNMFVVFVLMLRRNTSM